MATSIIKKAAKTLAKMDEPLDLTKRGMFRLPDKDQPLMEIPKGAPTVTEKTLEVAPEGVKGQKVTKSVIDTPVSRRTVVKSAGSQAAQRVMPKLPELGVPQVTAKDLFGSAKSMPELYASMLPLVRKVAPEELASMADRLGFTIDDIIAMSGEDLLPRGDLTMEGLTRFEELFPITASRVLKKAGGGIIKKATKAITKLDEPVDPARRSFFRLPESTNLPAPVAPPAPAPAVSGLGALEKAAQTPVSRRDVLKSAAGQAARAVMPSGLEALAAPVARSVVGQAARQAVAPTSVSLPALIVRHLAGKGGEDIFNKPLDEVRQMAEGFADIVPKVAAESGRDPKEVQDVLNNILAVTGREYFPRNTGQGFPSSLWSAYPGSDAMRYMDMNPVSDSATLRDVSKTLFGQKEQGDIKSVLREIRNESPKMYEGLVGKVRDYAKEYNDELNRTFIDNYYDVLYETDAKPSSVIKKIMPYSDAKERKQALQIIEEYEAKKKEAIRLRDEPAPQVKGPFRLNDPHPWAEFELGVGNDKKAIENAQKMLRSHGEKQQSKAGGGIIKKAAQAAAKAEPKEQKMLQGFYRGYSGDYDAQRAAQEAGKVYVTPQKALGDFYAEKRAAQTGQEPHLEMVLADPFAGKTYGHSVPGTKGEPPKVTRARRLKPEDVKSSTRLYAEGGAVAGSQFNQMVSNAMKSGMSEAEALRQLLPLLK